MIAVDATPLCLGPRGGVARALATHLAAWARVPPAGGVHLFAPHSLPPEVALPFPVTVPGRTTSRPRAFRRRLGQAIEAAGAQVLYVPFAAFPRTSVPTVVTVHELPFVRWGPIEGRARAWRFRTWLARARRHAAGVVVPSQAVRDDVRTLEPGATCVHVVPHGFDPAPWRAAARGVSRSPRPRAVVVGAGESGAGARKKGMDVLVSAVSDLRDVELDVVVVGHVRGPLPPGLRCVRGPDDRELAQLLASAHMLVHPARSEGFGYPPLEALALDTPVVATTGGALPEVLGSAALLVPPGDAPAHAGAIRRVLAEPDVVAALVAAGRERVAAFSPAAASARLADVLLDSGGLA